ncbi:unnamed protein product [Aphanomyces euteiches]|uniref:EF-hand domain-containing protein n=1 Tax=Aphanomyces euteiches TaxID=100861 RepID=A0A6G0X0R4_9STRA|nr:hypothetical protein Ae201684_009626 [Aphanomyces euteiches]KAH9085527.1 hypothetical protein Ae201684P_005233 [Aphanomyces euteiches]KAH9157870.1 hypothetical protein AeRB84_000342 [Aphanomyces euteiches]
MTTLQVEVPYVKNQVYFTVDSTLAKEIHTGTAALRKACKLERIQQEYKSGAVLEEDEYIAWMRQLSGVQTERDFQSIHSIVDVVHQTFEPYSIDMLDLTMGSLVLLDGSVQDKLRVALELSCETFPLLNEGALVRTLTNFLLSLYCLFSSQTNNSGDTINIVEVMQFSAAQTVVEITEHQPSLTFDGVWDWYLLMGGEHAPYLKLLDMTYWLQQEIISQASEDEPNTNEAHSSPLLFTLAHNDETKHIGHRHAIELEDILTASCFTVLQPQVMYDTFLQHTIDGWLDEATFEEGLNELTSMTCTNHLVEDDKFMTSMRQLFRNYLAPDAEKVEAFELAAGFSLFCVGSKSDKLAAGFHYFDTDDAGFLDNDQLWHFLRSVVVTILGLIPTEGTPILEFIESSANEIMQDLTESTYTFEQFGQWYNDGGFHAMSWLELLDLKKWAFVWPDFNTGVLDNEPIHPVSATMYYTTKNIRATNHQVDSDGPAPLTFEDRGSIHLDSVPPLCLKNEIVLEFDLPIESEQPVQSLCFDNGDLMHYMALQECTNLQTVDIRVAYGEFESFVDSTGVATLEKHEFNQCIERLLPSCRKQSAEGVQISKQTLADVYEHHEEGPNDEGLEALTSLFFAYNRFGTGKIDATEFVSGFLMLCAGSKSEKLLFCFALFDEDKDGFLTRREMWKFLRSFLTMLLALGNGADISAETIGSVCDAACIGITRSLFNDRSSDVTDYQAKVSFEEFAEWYSHQGYAIIPWIELLDPRKWPLVDPSIAQAVQNSGGATVGSSKKSSEITQATTSSVTSSHQTQHSAPAAEETSDEVRNSSSVVFQFKLTTYDNTTLRIRLRDVAVVYTIAEKLRLKTITVDVLYETFDRFARGKTLSKSGFLYAIRSLAPKGALSSEDQEFLSYHLLRIFALYETESAQDTDEGNGVAVDKLHLISGMSLFCQGSKSSKLGILFTFFDMHHEGSVTRRALFELFKSLLAILFSFSHTEALSSTEAKTYAAERAAGALISNVFCDTKATTHMSLSAFAEWYSNGGYETCPWLELLDLNKWPTKEAIEASTREKPLVYAFDMREETNLLHYTEKDIETYLSMLEATQFHELKVSDIHDAILQAARPLSSAVEDGLVVTRSSFYSCIRKLIPRTSVNEQGQQLASRILARLFGAYDRKKTGKVNALELACGMTILGQGSKSQKLASAFEMLVKVQKKGTNGNKIPHAMLFLYLRSFLLALMVLSESRYRHGIEHLYVEADELIGDATDTVLRDISSDDHTGLRSRNYISFEQFGEWYNSGGYETLSWVELLDVSKWQHQQPDGGGGGGGVRASDIGVTSAVLSFIVANDAMELVYTQSHIDALRECLEHVELHLYAPRQLVTVLKTFFKRHQAPSTDLLSPTVNITLTKEQCHNAVFHLCPRHPHCTNRYVGTFVDHLVAVLQDPETHQVSLVQLLCGLMVFTDGSLLEILIHGTALLCYVTESFGAAAETSSNGDRHIVPWNALQSCLDIFLQALYACSHSFDRIGANGVAVCAKRGTEEALSFFGDVYNVSGHIACEDFHDWFQDEGVKIAPWLGLVVLENWPQALNLDLQNRKEKSNP